MCHTTQWFQFTYASPTGHAHTHGERKQLSKLIVYRTNAISTSDPRAQHNNTRRHTQHRAALATTHVMSRSAGSSGTRSRRSGGTRCPSRPVVLFASQLKRLGECAWGNRRVSTFSSERGGGALRATLGGGIADDASLVLETKMTASLIIGNQSYIEGSQCGRTCGKP